ncbi:MFS transporter [Fodinicola acaciae]|uniref:MFS transporter n=1 Tax=Fodinicola acaciae TaxID=2681555 RepID=UPI001C9E7E8D|nr:MFS transporter [Fodinicola acaciae]
MTTALRPRTRDVLANREFRALWLAESQSAAGDQLAKVALMVLVYARTGSALWAAGVFALTFLPAIAGGLGLSQFADRFPRRNVLVVCSLGQATCLALMAIPHMPLPVLCLLVVLQQFLLAPANAAQNALAREVIEDDEVYVRSQDLRQISNNTIMLGGLAVGGFLIAAIGTSLALAIDAVSCLLAAATVWLLLSRRPAPGGEMTSWFSSTGWVFKQRRMRVLLTLSWLVGLAVVVEGLAAPLAKELHAGDAAVGWLLAADPLGFIIGAFVLSRFFNAQARLSMIGILSTASLAILVLFFFQPSLPLALFLLVVAGATGAYHISVISAVATWTPAEMRGGTNGVFRTGLRVSQGLGIAAGGVIAQLIGSSSYTIAICAVIGLLIAVPATISWARLKPTVAA